MTVLEQKLRDIADEKDLKLLPENLKAGVTCLGVTGTLEASTTSGGVKQFSTVEEMNSSTGNTEGDLAIVYRNEVQNATVDSQFQTATFPDTVVLDTALTDYVEVRYRAVDSSKMFDCMGQLDSSKFMMDCYTESGEIRIQYESSDGITYTRTDTTGNPVDFGTKIYYENSEMWNDAIGKFIQIGGSTFEGLYKYSGTTWELAPTDLTTVADEVYLTKFYGKNGVTTGTLTTNVSNSFADTNAAVYKKVQQAYNNMTPRVLTDTDKTIDKSIYFIPANSNNEVLLDTSAVTDASNMFAYCTNLAVIPLLNTSKVTKMRSMFISCTNLTTIPLLDTSKVTDMVDMFAYCANLTTIPLLDTSNVTNMQSMFRTCNNLTNIPLLNTNKVTSMKEMFSQCSSLIEVPLLDTSKVTNMHSMFISCTSLTTVPLLSTDVVTDMGYMFNDCPNLSDDSLNNVLAMCTNATAYTGAKTLKKIGLTSDQATKCATLSNYSAFTAAGWTTGY